MIETDVQIMKAIKILISEDTDVDGFLKDLNRIFGKRDSSPKGLPRALANEYPTLHRIWLEVKQNDS